ncbi:MAG: hypothetical protein EOO38_22055 [Cytophagaceae bacterium]|nr:MAG: hypothetical protein EOO38_22055 [Cytophagaceae bacterium]
MRFTIFLPLGFATLSTSLPTTESLDTQKLQAQQMKTRARYAVKAQDGGFWNVGELKVTGGCLNNVDWANAANFDWEFNCRFYR